MWRKTKKTIRWAAHRWMFRVRSPKGTSAWIRRMSEYAWVADGA